MLKRFWSVVALVATLGVFSPLSAQGVLQLEVDSPAPPLGSQLYALYVTETGHSLNIYLNSMNVVNNENEKYAEIILGYEFEDGTQVLSKTTIFPDGSTQLDSNYAFFKSHLLARPDLQPLFGKIISGNVIPSNGCIPSDPNLVYTMGLWTSFWDWCRANIIDPVMEFFETLAETPCVSAFVSGFVQIWWDGFSSKDELSFAVNLAPCFGWN